MKEKNTLYSHLGLLFLIGMFLFPMKGYANINSLAEQLIGNQVNPVLQTTFQQQQPQFEELTTPEASGETEVTDEPSRIETLTEASLDFSVEDIYSRKKELRQYGYDLFSGTPLTFAPVSDAPIPSNYIIGPGDEINILLFGSQFSNKTHTVSREGYLYLPDPVPVAGMNFAELKESLSSRFANQMIGVKANISLGKLRTIRVFALGNVQKPGSYTLSALSTLTNAILSSGGIKKIGTLRNIQLKRNGKVISEFDLYDLLLNGDTSKDQKLLPGDVVFVPPIGQTASIYGAVHRPAIYELKPDSRNLEQLLYFAGGLMPTASLSNTIVQTIDTKEKASVFKVDLTSKAGKEHLVNNGDIVIIQHGITQNGGSVFLSGEVQRPGIYPIENGEKISSVIQRAGGFTEAAFLKGSVFTRVKLKKLEENNTNIALDKLEKDLILSQNKTKAVQAIRDVNAIRGVIQKIRETYEPQGRMAINLDKVLEDGDYDLTLFHGDTLHVPATPQEITVIGEVNHPTSHIYNANYDIEHYVNSSGGLKKNADSSQIYVVKPNGEVTFSGSSIKGFFRKGFSQATIAPGDIIVIPLDAEKATSLEILKSVSEVTSQVAITLAGFTAIGIF